MYFAPRGILPSTFLSMPFVDRVFLYESMCQEIKHENAKLELLIKILTRR